MFTHSGVVTVIHWMHSRVLTNVLTVFLSTVKPICLQPYLVATSLLHPSLCCCTAAYFGLLIGWVIWNHWKKKVCEHGWYTFSCVFKTSLRYWRQFASVMPIFRTLSQLQTIFWNLTTSKCITVVLRGTTSVPRTAPLSVFHLWFVNNLDSA